MIINIFLKKRSLIDLFLFLLILETLFSENNYRPVISSIQIQGNSKTQNFIIEREIQHPLNIPLDSNLVLKDRDRIENLGLFSEVKWKLTPIEDGTAILFFIVIESIQKTPPIALPTYDEDKGWSLTGIWLINNFRGRNQSLAIGGSIGGEDTYGFNYSDPWIFGDHVSFSLNIGRSLYKHRFLNRELDVNSFVIKFGRWFGNSIKTSFGFELEKKKFFNDVISYEYFYLAPMVTFKYDTRDIFWNPSKGVLFSQYVYHQKGLKPRDWSKTLWTQSYSLYKKINNNNKKLIFAFNGTLSRMLGNKDEHWLDYFGNSMTIRGWVLPDSSLYYSGVEDFRFGFQSARTTFELRQEVIPKYATPIGIEFGLVFVIFSDIGIITNEWNSLKNQSPMLGTGLGFRIPFPMVGSIRIDYGWGYRNGGWNSGSIHWAIGQKF